MISALSSLSLARLQAERSQCLDALMKIARGENVQVRSIDGRMVSYSPANLDALERLLDAIERAIQAKGKKGRLYGPPILPRI